MKRLEGSRILSKHLTDELVIAALGFGAPDLYAAKDRPQNIYMQGGMSLAAPIGLGMALTVPDRKVVIVDGDGGLLMGLGILATIAMEAPRNLVHLVWDNGQWATTGGQSLATSQGTSLTKIAHGAGIEKSFQVEDLETLEKTIVRALREEGPWFICAKVQETGPSKGAPFDIDINVIRFLDQGLTDGDTEGVLGGWRTSRL